MYVRLSYDQEFDDLYLHLRSKYPKELFDLDGIGKQLDMHQFAQEFYGIGGAAADVSIDANANVVGRDVITYNFEMPKPFHKLNSYYLLWRTLRKKHSLEVANSIIEMQLNGDIYINDAWDLGRPYCFNFSTYDIALEGLPMGDRVKPVAPKSLYSFVRQVEQFTVYAANSTLGATGLADLLIVMAWYVDQIAKDAGRDPECGCKLGKWTDNRIGLDGQSAAWAYVKEVLASFIYTLNWQFRGNQSPFTNISLYDRKFLEELVPGYVINGTTPEVETVWQLQQAFMEIMNEELRRAPLTFPVTTACFATDSDGSIMDEEFLSLVSEQNREFGFINIYCGSSSTLSSCCRLRSDTSSEYFNSFGAGSTKIGSLGVVTLNLPRLATAFTVNDGQGGKVYNKEGFLAHLKKLVWVAAQVNDAKRYIVGRRAERGNLPLYKLGHMDLKKQYSTVGITGLNEAVEILGMDILQEEGQEFVLSILETCNTVNDEMTQALGYPHNCEQVPAENSSIKLASKDRLLCWECGDQYPYYSNQFIPLTTKADMLDRIRLQGMFDKHFSGGAICHLNVAERISDPERIADLIRSCAKQGVVYFAINYMLQRCAVGHMTVGKGESCPACGQPIADTFTRVVGFLTNTKNWHKVRREYDAPHRQFYEEV